MLHLLESRIGRDLFRGRLLIVAIGVILTVAACALSIWRPPFLRTFDRQVYDLLLRTSSHSSSSPQVVIVEIDDASLQRYGQWPWPRSLLALLLERIRRAAPRAVGVDVVFAEPDRGRSEDLAPELQKQLKELLGSATLPPPDRLLAEVLGRGPFALGYKFYFDAKEASLRAGAEPEALNLTPPATSLFQAQGRLGILPVLAEAVSASGFLNAVADRDGVFRRIPLLIAEGDRLYPSLALATLLRGEGGSPAVAVAGEELFLWWRGRRIPLDAQGNFLIDFPAARGAWRRLAAAELLENPASGEILHDRVVFLGVNASGLDTRLTSPLGETFMGVEIHARVAANISRGDFIRIPDWFSGVAVLLLLMLGLAMPLLLAWISPWAGLLAVAATGFGLWMGSAWLLDFHGLYLSPVMPLLLLAALLAAVTLLRFRFEEQRSHRQEAQTEFMQNFMMQSLCSLASIRDSETGGHIQRTEKYLRLIAEELRHHPVFGKILTAETIDLLCRLASLHDIGKVGVPDMLLLKPGRLTGDEYEEIKKHTLYGRQVIDEAERRAGVAGGPALQMAREIVYSHHEWWDGSGYPEGLKGEAIPLAGRLMAIADVYDALVCQRIYKPSLSHETAVEIIRRRSGSQFDPEIVTAFLRIEQDWRRIYADLKGNGHDEELMRQASEPIT